ncbi:MAG: hypothetical protein FWH41_04130 [Treponema sp.]|nr:hypothetical protein [Treponema sp.]
MKKNFYIDIVLFCVILYPSCLSQPKLELQKQIQLQIQQEKLPLDITTITGEIPIYFIELQLDKELDKENLGLNLFVYFFIEHLDGIIYALNEIGIKADEKYLIEEYKGKYHIDVEEKETPTGLKNVYSRNTTEKPPLRITLVAHYLGPTVDSLVTLVIVDKDGEAGELDYLYYDLIRLGI